VRLNVHHHGAPDAPVFVYLHGVQGYGGRVRRLASGVLAGYRVLGLDLRGHGYSGWEPPWSLEQHLADVRETLAAEGVTRAVCAGHSFGGRLVTELGDGIVERAVLLDPALHIPPADALQRASDACTPEVWGSVEDAVDAAVGSDWLPLAPPALMREVYADELELGDDGLFRPRYAHAAVAAGLGELARPWPATPPQVPTLIVLGEQTWLQIDPELAHYRELLGDLLEVVIVPGGHSVLWDAEGETFAAISAFLLGS
jgi:lipase